MLTLAEMPPVEVLLVPSGGFWGGVGEAGGAAVAPAVANALFVAAGNASALCRSKRQDSIFHRGEPCAANIRTLYNFEPPATDEEIYAASLQFIRKLSGYNKPSKANEVPFNRAVVQVAAVARMLIDTLEKPPPNRATGRSKPRVPARGRRSGSEVPDALVVHQVLFHDLLPETEYVWVRRVDDRTHPSGCWDGRRFPRG
jgi:hypothetical protein